MKAMHDNDIMVKCSFTSSKRFGKCKPKTVTSVVPTWIKYQYFTAQQIKALSPMLDLARYALVEGVRLPLIGLKVIS